MRDSTLLAVVNTHVRHARSTSQAEDAATELGMDLAAYRAAVDEARELGHQVDRVLPRKRTPEA